MLIFSFSFLKEKIVLKSNINLINYVGIFLIICFYNFHLFNTFNKKYLDNDYVSYRTGFKNVTDLMKTNKNVSLLTFDSRLMVWAILNDVAEIKPLSGQLVSKTHLMIENDLIDSFKFLKLDYSNFSKFLKINFLHGVLPIKILNYFFGEDILQVNFKPIKIQKILVKRRQRL